MRTLTSGEFFGEQALYFNTTRSMTVRAASDVICLALSREMIMQVIGNKLQDMTFRNIEKWALDKSGTLSKLSKIQIEKLLDNSVYSTFDKKTVLINKGDNVFSKIIVCVEGEIYNVFSPINNFSWMTENQSPSKDQSGEKTTYQTHPKTCSTSFLL